MNYPAPKLGHARLEVLVHEVGVLIAEQEVVEILERREARRAAARGGSRAGVGASAAQADEDGPVGLRRGVRG